MLDTSSFAFPIILPRMFAVWRPDFNAITCTGIEIKKIVLLSIRKSRSQWTKWGCITVVCHMLAALRVQIFYRLLRPYSTYKRRIRTALFMDRMGLWSGMRIIDLGGTPEIWAAIQIPLDITLINNGQDPCVIRSSDKTPHKFSFLNGDACELDAPSNSFDLVFSNSAIEHVGNSDRQKAFAANACRLAPKYWVQTPAKWFPIEAHNGMLISPHRVAHMEC